MQRESQPTTPPLRGNERRAARSRTYISCQPATIECREREAQVSCQPATIECREREVQVSCQPATGWYPCTRSPGVLSTRHEMVLVNEKPRGPVNPPRDGTRDEKSSDRDTYRDRVGVEELLVELQVVVGT